MQAIQAVQAPLRAAGLQGWQTDAGGWVSRLRLSAVDAALANALRELDLLLASVDELGGEDGPDGIGRLRAWAGTGPELVVTAGAAGAWVDDRGGFANHVPAEVVVDRHTIGAGDAFAAVLAAQRGAGLDLHAAAAIATRGDGSLPSRRDHRRQSTPWTRMPTWPTWPRRRGAQCGSGPTSRTSRRPMPSSVSRSKAIASLASPAAIATWVLGRWRTAGCGSSPSTMFCDGLMELEGAYLAALQGATAVTRDEDRLAFRGPDGGTVAEFSRTT